MKKTSYLVALFIAASFISCKKDSSTTPSSAAAGGSSNPNSRNIFTIAGNGTRGYFGDGMSATSTGLYNPYGVVVDKLGNLYIADNDNYRIRKVDTNGIISTFAGNGTSGYAGDGAAATSAELASPYGVAVDDSGNLYIADAGNNRIRKVNIHGIILTVAGNGSWGYSGDGAAATTAKLNGPIGVATDHSGNLYIADAGNNRIRKVNTNGIISTIAGNGSGAYSGDGGLATSAELFGPSGITIDRSGYIYIADFYNNCIRKINPNGIISTIAGSGTPPNNYGFSGDGGPANMAELHFPCGVALDASGNLYITDGNNYRIRIVNTSGIIYTFAGNGTGGYSGDGGLATAAELLGPTGIAIDKYNNIFISDLDNQRIRKVYK